MDALVTVHSWLRWLVLVAAVAALAVALANWFGQGVSEKMARQITLLYVISLDVQVMLGIIIWVVEQRWAGGGRQFQLEHPLLMLIALAVAHVAAARARRAAGPREMARIRALGVGASSLLILVGIPWRS